MLGFVGKRTCLEQSKISTKKGKVKSSLSNLVTFSSSKRLYRTEIQPDAIWKGPLNSIHFKKGTEEHFQNIINLEGSPKASSLFKALGWASCWDGLLLKIIFANSRSGLLLETNAASIKIDDYKAMSKIITQSFQPQKMHKCHMILKKNIDLVINYLKKEQIGFPSKRVIFFSRTSPLAFFWRLNGITRW